LPPLPLPDIVELFRLRVKLRVVEIKVCINFFSTGGGIYATTGQSLTDHSINPLKISTNHIAVLGQVKTRPHCRITSKISRPLL